jgi:hypothetical protein
MLSYNNIKDILDNYELNIVFLKELDAIIGGSTALNMYMTLQNVDSIYPNDIDIFFSEGSDIDCVIDDLLRSGYILESDKDMKKHLEQYKFKGDILKVVTLYKHSKCIQLILVEDNNKQFILEKTDLNITRLYYDFKEEYIIIDNNIREDIDRGYMWISAAYNGVIDGEWGIARKKKLEDRIEKYRKRGFRLFE